METTIDLNDRGRFNQLGDHSHHCPECYGDVACEHRCYIEPDQCDWDERDALGFVRHEPIMLRARGAIIACDACVRRAQRSPSLSFADDPAASAAAALELLTAQRDTLAAALRRYGGHEGGCPALETVVTGNVRLSYYAWSQLTPQQKRERFMTGVVITVADDADGHDRFSTGSGLTGKCDCGFIAALRIGSNS